MNFVAVFERSIILVADVMNCYELKLFPRSEAKILECKIVGYFFFFSSTDKRK